MSDRTALDTAMRHWRRHLHAHPEFGFEEVATAQFVVDRLREAGLTEIETGIGGTGVVATLRRGSGPRIVALRADMDCLRIEERTNLPHASRTPGLMHACGHDGHTATLIGAATMLARAGGFDGTVRFVFQPAEEWGQGMQAMIRDGLGSRLGFDEIYGLHNKPGLAVGAFETRPGAFMAAEDNFVIAVAGSGGHASQPHNCRDAILCAAAIVCDLQTIIARRIDPAELAVVSVTGIHGDNVRNAIAGEARIEGDCRHYDTSVSETIEQTMRDIATGQALAHGCRATLDYTRIFVPLVNDTAATGHALAAARTVFGEASVNGAAPAMGGAEDFAHALAIAPGAFVNIGNGDSAALHSAAFDYNDDALLSGAAWFAELVRQRLPIAPATA